MKRMLKMLLAKLLLRGMDLEKADEPTAIKFNHLNSILISRGVVKFDWYKARGIKVTKCSKCLKVLAVGECVKGVRCERC